MQTTATGASVTIKWVVISLLTEGLDLQFIKKKKSVEYNEAQRSEMRRPVLVLFHPSQ